MSELRKKLYQLPFLAFIIAIITSFACSPGGEQIKPPSELNLKGDQTLEDSDTQTSDNSRNSEDASVLSTLSSLLPGDTAMAAVTEQQDCKVVNTDAGLVITCGENGAFLKHGMRSLVNHKRLDDIDESICPGKNGANIESGLDENNDKILQDSEIMNTSYL